MALVNLLLYGLHNGRHKTRSVVWPDAVASQPIRSFWFMRTENYPTTISFNSLPTLKKGSFLGRTVIGSPVLGFRPV